MTAETSYIQDPKLPVNVIEIEGHQLRIPWAPIPWKEIDLSGKMDWPVAHHDMERSTHWMWVDTCGSLEEGKETIKQHLKRSLKAANEGSYVNSITESINSEKSAYYFGPAIDIEGDIPALVRNGIGIWELIDDQLTDEERRERFYETSPCILVSHGIIPDPEHSYWINQGLNMYEPTWEAAREIELA